MKRLLFFIAVLSLLVSFGNEGWVRLYQLRRVGASIEEQNRLVALQNDKIRHEIEDLRDPKYLERFIRNEMGYAREGETLYEFIEPR
ncbi:MAG TPA: septum formation initiator family protein [bacterium]|nr:septum formation initiator family protein [bacterium]